MEGHVFHSLWAECCRLSMLGAKVSSEIPLVLYSPRVANALTENYYARHATYSDSRKWRSGLFPFEKRMVTRFFPKPPAHILLHGAGSGRELLALRAMGYRVTAFEPIRVLVEAGNCELAKTDTPIQCAAVQDWERWAFDRYAAVFMGWTVWTHMMEQRERLSALEHMRKVCPRGPLLLSFFSAEKLFDEWERKDSLPPLHPPPQGKFQLLTRYWLRQRLLRMPPLERGTGWLRGFYFHAVHREELAEEANRTGWKVAYYENNPRRYAHAVLIPNARAR